jgi:curved DNA-binding protein CbpA
MGGSPDPDPDAPDYYGLVGLARDASQGEVDGALTRAKGYYHPDQSSLDEATANRCFDRVRDAEAVLCDPDRRAAYDTFLDRFGPADGHAEFQQWTDDGELVDPADWNPDGATGTAERPGGHTETTGREQHAGGGERDTARTTAERAGSRRTGRSRRRGTAGRTQRRGAGSETRRRESAGETRQRESAARTASSRTTGQRSQMEARAIEYGIWAESARARVASVRDRLAASRLGVFRPLTTVVDDALNAAIVPGVYARQRIPWLAQLGLVSALLVTAHGLVQLSDPVMGIAGLSVLLLSTLPLYAGGLLLWLLAAVLTYLVDGFAPPFYVSVAVLVLVACYGVLTALKANHVLAASGTD